MKHTIKILLSLFCILSLGLFINRKAYSKEINSAISPKEFVRDHSQTFLTFPEWYLVFSPKEYADFTKVNVSNNFTYFGHIKQFWESYYKIILKTKNDKINYEYHTMILVIGISTTVEYLFRGLYEYTVGNFSYWITGRVPEDDFTATYAKEYVEFINITPWYEFDFDKKIKELYTNEINEFSFRTLERRFILSLELMIKSVYGKIIKKATKTTFGNADLMTSVIVDQKLDLESSNIKFSAKIGEYYLYEFPRYDPFRESVISVKDQNFNFIEIAGNNMNILISVLSRDISHYKNYDIFFKQKILTKKGLTRLLLIVPISELKFFVRSHESELEHIFDY